MTTTQNAKIRVKYLDGTEEIYNSIIEAEKGILETVTGCDFATTVVEFVEFTNNGETKELFCKWGLELIE